jgi:RimJ/RimL family protein N-acetyltransferase
VALARLESERLVLEPLRVVHVDELAPLLDDPDLHEYIGGEPPTRDELRRRVELREQGIDRLAACIDPRHAASMAVARSIGLVPTETIVDGEVRWQSPSSRKEPHVT